MRLSATDIYAFQALGYLGTQAGRQQGRQQGRQAGDEAAPGDAPAGVRWVGSDDISEATGVARPYLVRILATLSGSGIVASKKGAGGGYRLARAAEEITLRDVMRAIDGPVAPLSCVSLNWHQSCVVEERCHARSHVWLRVRDALLEALAQATVADLAEDFRRGIGYHPCLDHLLRPNP